MAAGYEKNRSNAQCASGVLPGRREETKFFAAGGRRAGTGRTCPGTEQEKRCGSRLYSFICKLY